MTGFTVISPALHGQTSAKWRTGAFKNAMRRKFEAVLVLMPLVDTARIHMGEGPGQPWRVIFFDDKRVAIGRDLCFARRQAHCVTRALPSARAHVRTTLGGGAP